MTDQAILHLVAKHIPAAVNPWPIASAILAELRRTGLLK